jgi:hypothetical protein
MMHPKPLEKPKCEFHNETMKKRKIDAHPLTHNTCEVGGHAGALGWD